MVVVPGHPLLEVEILAFYGIKGVKEHIEAPVLETIVELLDLPIVLGVIGFVFDVGDSCCSAGSREPRSPLPSAVRANGTNDEGGMDDDVVEKAYRVVLVTVFIELRHCKP